MRGQPAATAAAHGLPEIVDICTEGGLWVENGDIFGARALGEMQTARRYSIP